MGFRSALLGCGGRAQGGHAVGYEHATGGKLVAICDMNEQRLNACGDRFGIAARYSDLDTMLERERPDVVHLVTPPTLRVGLMCHLSDAGVPGVIVEKPICIGGDDYLALRRLAASSKTKFVVNHQLRHHRLVLDMLDAVRNGDIGQVRCLDASAVLPMSGQGVHVLDLMFAFNGYAQPTTVFGAISGYTDLNGTHPSAASAEFLLNFANGARGILESGVSALRFEEAPDWGHKRIAVYGTHGFVHWRMNGYERSRPDGSVEAGPLDYRYEDDRAQGRLTDAMFAWLADDSQVHPNNLSTSLDEWEVILGGYASAVEGQPINLPFEPAEDLLAQLQRKQGVPETASTV